MKIKIFIAIVSFVFCARFAAFAHEPQQQFIDCGNVKVVPFQSEPSRDGRYTVGWTIRPRTKKAKPVNWSLWESGDPDSNFLYHYPWDSGETKNPPYELVDFIVDLQEHKAVEFSQPWDMPTRTPTVSWSREIGGRQYGFLSSERQFGTSDFRLIVIGRDGVRPVSLVEAMRKAVDEYLRMAYPKKSKKLSSIFFTADGNGVSSDGGTAWISFSAENSDDLVADVNGMVAVSLPAGAVGKVSEEDPAELPFKEDAALAKADAELNRLYAELQKKLDPTARAALKVEQREWIGRRNQDAAHAAEMAKNGGEDAFAARLKSLVEATQKRSAALGASLAAH